MSPQSPIVFVNARLLDPAGDTASAGGLIVLDGTIADLGPRVRADDAPPGARIVDCRGAVLAPGIVDMRCTIGEPGGEHRETIASASAAAAAGGVTTIVARPDSSPPVDDPAVVDFIRRRARDHARVRVETMAALTKGMQGREISEIGLLREAGAVAFCDGAASVRDASVMRRALRYARDFDALVAPVALDADLAGAGVMREGPLATRLGLPGLPREAETVALERDLRLVALTGARYHAAFVSNDLSLQAIRRAKDAGLPVSCGVGVNHLALNETDVGDYRTFLKLAPPLGREEERIALVDALSEGLIDVVVSDHDPQDVEAKRLPFAEAAFGAIGLETMLSAGLRLVAGGRVSLARLWSAWSTRPAELLGLPAGRLVRGAPADLVLFDPDEPYVVDPSTFRSRCRNTPFEDARMQGRVKMTLVAGCVAYE